MVNPDTRTAAKEWSPPPGEHLLMVLAAPADNAGNAEWWLTTRHLYHAYSNGHAFLPRNEIPLPRTATPRDTIQFFILQNDRQHVVEMDAPERRTSQGYRQPQSFLWLDANDKPLRTEQTLSTAHYSFNDPPTAELLMLHLSAAGRGALLAAGSPLLAFTNVSSLNPWYETSTFGAASWQRAAAAFIALFIAFTAYGLARFYALRRPLLFALASLLFGPPLLMTLISLRNWPWNRRPSAAPRATGAELFA
jgi:hypothetical protein